MGSVDNFLWEKRAWCWKNILVYINKFYKNYKKYKNNQYDILANINTICKVWLF